MSDLFFRRCPIGGVLMPSQRRRAEGEERGVDGERCSDSLDFRPEMGGDSGEGGRLYRKSALGRKPLVVGRSTFCAYAVATWV